MWNKLRDWRPEYFVLNGSVGALSKLQVPGNYTIVDHALTRLERGLAGILSAEGPPNRDIYNGQMMSGMGH